MAHINNNNKHINNNAYVNVGNRICDIPVKSNEIKIKLW